jgi:hypothetical protein
MDRLNLNELLTVFEAIFVKEWQSSLGSDINLLMITARDPLVEMIRK